MPRQAEEDKTEVSTGEASDTDGGEAKATDGGEADQVDQQKQNEEEASQSLQVDSQEPQENSAITLRNFCEVYGQNIGDICVL